MVSISIPTESVSKVCRRFRVREMALFGSVLRSDFGPDSDVDILVTFEPDAPLDLFDMAQLKEALEAIFQRPVDLVEKKAIKNPFRKKEILSHMEIVYAT